MSRTSLDDLLGRSAPRLDHTAESDRAASELVRGIFTERDRQIRLTKLSLGVGGVIAALSLSVGTAFALPGITWWPLWVPESDITYTTGPVELSGDTVICKFRIAVLTDGQTADDGTVQRLYAARAFLHSVDFDDYKDEAAAAAAAWPADDDTPREIAFWNGMSLAIVEAMNDRGLIGGGVSVTSDGKCTPAP
jgi:hypothetical protein